MLSGRVREIEPAPREEPRGAHQGQAEFSMERETARRRGAGRGLRDEAKPARAEKNTRREQTDRREDQEDRGEKWRVDRPLNDERRK